MSRRSENQNTKPRNGAAVAGTIGKTYAGAGVAAAATTMRVCFAAVVGWAGAR